MVLVKIGTLGTIKPLLKVASKRQDHTDLVFHCLDGKLECHQFIIGSQSTFLKSLILLNLKNELRDSIHISLDGVYKHHMEIILKFLYTGSLKIKRIDIPKIKELLETILRIDAKLKLDNFPLKEKKADAPKPPPPPPSTSDDPPPPPPKKDSSFGGPSSSNNDNNGNEDDPSPPPKKFKHSENTESLAEQPPLSPPHSLSGSDRFDDIEAEEDNGKEDPPRSSKSDEILEIGDTDSDDVAVIETQDTEDEDEDGNVEVRSNGSSDDEEAKIKKFCARFQSPDDEPNSCPVCKDEHFDDEEEFKKHVKSHYDLAKAANEVNDDDNDDDDEVAEPCNANIVKAPKALAKKSYRNKRYLTILRISQALPESSRNVAESPQFRQNHREKISIDRLSWQRNPRLDQ